MKDNYCPEGHSIIEVKESLLYSHYFYCKECNKIFVPTLIELNKSIIEKTYCSDRYNELIEHAKFLEAKSRVKLSDLKKLGYL